MTMIKYSAKVKGSNLYATYYKVIEIFFYDEPDDFALRGKILSVAKQQMGPGLAFEIKKIVKGDWNEEEEIN
jgi:hypothetical protein